MSMTRIDPIAALRPEPRVTLPLETTLMCMLVVARPPRLVFGVSSALAVPLSLPICTLRGSEVEP